MTGLFIRKQKKKLRQLKVWPTLQATLGATLQQKWNFIWMVNLHIANLDELIGPVPYKRFYFKSPGKSNDQNSLKPHPEGGLCIKSENFTTSGLFHNFPKSVGYLSLSSGSTLSMWWNRILRNSSGSAGRQVLQYLIWSNFCVAADNTDGFFWVTWNLLVFRKNRNMKLTKKKKIKE